MKFSKFMSESIDWLGVVLIVSAFALSSFGVVQTTSLLYAGFNIIGSACIAGVSFLKRDFQPMTLNLIWLIVALIALGRQFLH